MDGIKIQVILRASALATAVSVFILLLLLRRTAGTEQKILRAYRELAGFLKGKGEAGSWYQSYKGWLIRNGAAFHYGLWVEPVRFSVLCLILGLTGLSVGMVGGAWCGAGLFLGLLLLPVILLTYLNRRDNERMLPELKLVYHALEIQTKAGVYITDALAECYGSVQDKRLRKALLELAGDIVMKADTGASLEKFQGKFDNRYIDSLCIIILQAMESGQAVELLHDIGEQIKDMEEAVMEQRKAALDRKITLCQLGVLTVVLGIALYACVTYMFNAASAF